MSYINFNNAGSSYLTEKTQKIVKDFFGLEQMQEDYDYKNSYWWYDDKLISIENRVDIDDDKIKIMKDYGVAYEHSI